MSEHLPDSCSPSRADTLSLPSLLPAAQPDGVPPSLAPDAAETLPAPVPAQETIPGHIIEEELGRGGMGVVYRARQVKLNRTVALKMILHAEYAGAEARRRFLNEAQALARLQHPHIVQVYEVGEHQDKPFFSLEYVEGGSLDKQLAGTPLPTLVAAHLVEQLADAMQTAHMAGVIHRDLKPGNVLLASGRREPPVDGPTGGSRLPLAGCVPKVTDFGLARNAGDAGQTQSGAIVGTPSYMAPEQAAGKVKEIDARTDVYALGAILYECLTGRPPFRAATAMDTVLQVLQDEPVPVRQLQPGVPRDLETVCHKCLQKAPSRRYATAWELAEELGRFLRGEPVQARPVGRLERAWRWCRRNPLAASVLLLVALLIGAATYSVAQVQGRTEADAARTAAETEKERADVERGKAVEASKLADTRRAETLIEKQKVERLQEQLDWTLYVKQLELVGGQWQKGNVQQASETLGAIRRERRGWEYGHLYHRVCQPERTFQDHTGTVTSVRFSPDGSRLASGSYDGTIVIRSATTGRTLLTLRHTNPDSNVTFSPDGKRLAVAGADQTVKVWDATAGREVLTLEGHTGRVESVAFSADGQRLASGSYDRTVKVWDARTGRDLLTLRGHKATVSSVCFSSDLKRLVSGSQDQTVRVWDTATGQPLLTLKGHTSPVASVCFSPDGRRLVSGGQDRTVKVWDTRSGQVLLTIKGHTLSVTSVAFSPDGRRLASGSADATLRVWDAATGQELHTLRGHTLAVSSVSFSADGRRLASSSADWTVKVWDAVRGAAPLTLEGYAYDVLSVAFSPDGRRLASAGFDHTVRIWDAYSGRILLALKGHTFSVSSVAFSPDGRRLASGGYDRTVRLWDARTGQALRTLKGHKGWVYSVSFSPDGRRLASGSGDRKVKVWDTHTGREVLSLEGHTSWVTSVALSPDGKRLASGSNDKTVRVWDATTGRNLLTLQGDIHSVSCIGFSPDGRRLAVARYRQVTVWDALTGQYLLTLKGHADLVQGVAFSPDGKRLATASWDKTVKVWNAATAQEALTLEGHTGNVNSVCFSPDGKRLASGGVTIKLWDAPLGQPALTLGGHTGILNCLCFSPDGRRLASGSMDNTVKVWDVATGKESHTLRGHAGAVSALSFSADGQQLASGSYDQTVKVWDARTGRDLLTLRGHKATVSRVAFSPDGKRLVSGSLDKMARVWDAATGQLLLSLRGHKASVSSVCFSPDGRRLASGSWDRTVKIWDAATGRLLLTLDQTDWIDGVAFSPDGRGLAVTSSRGERVFWDLAAAKPAPGARELVRSGTTVSPDGHWLAVSTTNSIRLIRRWGSEERPGLRALAEPDAGWHDAEARANEVGGNWFAAAFHLGRLQGLRPQDATVGLRRACSLAHLDADGERPRDWRRVLEELRLAAQQPGSPLATWEDLLLAQRSVGWEGACRSSAHELLGRFENSNQLNVLHRVVFICRVVPWDGADALVLVRLARRLTTGRPNAARLDLLGAALYRARRFEEATRTLQQAIKVHGQGGYVDSWLFLAMTHQRLGRAAEAHTYLARFETWVKGRKFLTWQEAARWRLLHEEARRLIQVMPRAAQ